MIEHRLHEKIGNLIVKEFGEIKESDKVKKTDGVIRDTACKGEHRLPLFSDETEFCDVDMLILKNNKVKVIFEIEESNVKPTQVCGKFLASALSKSYKYRDNIYWLDEEVLFIQILDYLKLENKSKHPENSKKPVQWENLKKAIQNIIKSNYFKIKEYDIYVFKLQDDQIIALWKDFDFNAMIKEIKEFLKK